MPTKSDRGVTKSSVCSTCGKTFSRPDHMKRHQLRHTGTKPYACIFCGLAFTRSDNLRDHYDPCVQRKGRPIPDASRGGRKSHACDSCTHMKLGCDGNQPCQTCRLKKVECKFSRLKAKGGPPGNTTSNHGMTPRTPSFLKRGSIDFLLNSGTSNLIDSFRFPFRQEKRNIFNTRHTQRSPDSPTTPEFLGGTSFGTISDNGSSPSDPFDVEPFDWSIFDDDSLDKFFSGPFSEKILPDDPYNTMFDPSFTFSGSQSPLNSFHYGQYQTEWEPPTSYSDSCVQEISNSVAVLGITIEEHAEVANNLKFLFSPSRMNRLVKIYFEFWHPDCPIIHQPSFRIDKAPTALVIAVVILGALYSDIERETGVAKTIFDAAELYIYSLPDLTDDNEIRQMMSWQPPNDNAYSPYSASAIKSLQSAYLMMCAQFWAGNVTARKRATDSRFNVIVKIARRMGLTKARHDLWASSDEASWIQKESEIRLMSTITLIDCAFSFYVNFPCRLSLTELRNDLPCEEHFYNSLHPFNEHGFTPCRGTTTYDAFQSLFALDQAISNKKPNPLGLTPQDLFVLIHLLYVYTVTQVTLFPHRNVNVPNAPNELVSTIQQAPVLIKIALSHWNSLWTIIRASIPDHTWSTLGVFKNGYNYWLTTHLMINNKESGEMMRGIEIGCDDTLKHLKTLLKDVGMMTRSSPIH